MTTSPDVEHEIADQYRHSDGAVEIVLTVEEGRVLTIKEYPDPQLFADTVTDSDFLGTNEAVASLPDIAAFRKEFDFDESPEE
jgi:hypothetical protein